jgi:hypothetical protein
MCLTCSALSWRGLCARLKRVLSTNRDNSAVRSKHLFCVCADSLYRSSQDGESDSSYLLFLLLFFFFFFLIFIFFLLYSFLFLILLLPFLYLSSINFLVHFFCFLFIFHFSSIRPYSFKLRSNIV